jgi:hypothetical protein
MGYTTVFEGGFGFSRPLTIDETDYIKKFNETRRMKRNVEKLYELFKGEHGNPFLPKEETYGNDGEYFVGGSGFAGQDRDDSVVDYNTPPGQLDFLTGDFNERWTQNDLRKKEGKCQPSLWCQWVTNKDGTRLMWDGGEKFYNYCEWLNYLINHFFEKWGVKLNGEVYWTGEESKDMGKIVVKDNKVIVKHARVTYH